MSEDIVFYTNPMSRGRIVRWMLEEVGQAYQTEIIFYGEAMKSAGYRVIATDRAVPHLSSSKLNARIGAVNVPYRAKGSKGSLNT